MQQPGRRPSLTGRAPRPCSAWAAAPAARAIQAARLPVRPARPAWFPEWWRSGSAAARGWWRCPSSRQWRRQHGRSALAGPRPTVVPAGAAERSVAPAGLLSVSNGDRRMTGSQTGRAGSAARRRISSRGAPGIVLTVSAMAARTRTASSSTKAARAARTCSAAGVCSAPARSRQQVGDLRGQQGAHALVTIGGEDGVQGRGRGAVHGNSRTHHHVGVHGKPLQQVRRSAWMGRQADPCRWVAQDARTWHVRRQAQGQRPRSRQGRSAPQSRPCSSPGIPARHAPLTAA